MILLIVCCVCFVRSCERGSELRRRRGSMLTNLPTHVWFSWQRINCRNTGRPFNWAADSGPGLLLPWARHPRHPLLPLTASWYLKFHSVLFTFSLLLSWHAINNTLSINQQSYMHTISWTWSYLGKCWASRTAAMLPNIDAIPPKDILSSGVL